MRLILVNGVYGAPEHFDPLRRALTPRVHTEVFPFRREGDPDPGPERGFAPIIQRLDRVVVGAATRAQGGDAVAAEASAEAGFAPRPVLFGFSLGGALSIEYAFAHPERVSALILVNAFDRYQVGTLQPGAVPPFWRVPMRIQHRSYMSRLVHGVPWLRRGLFHDEATLDDVERGMQLAASTVGHDDLRFQLAHLCLPLPAGQAERLAHLAETMPVLLIASRDDMVVHPSHTARLADCMPAARRLPPFAGGHAFFQHDGGALGAAILGFLDGLEAHPASGPEPPLGEAGID